jgi:Tfp pilus assembly pilus retraction ATPase PilT
MDLNRLLTRAVAVGASDVLLKLGQPPVVRKDGDLGVLDGWPALNDANLEGVLEIVGARSPERLQLFRDLGDLDIAYEDEVEAAVASLTSIIEPIMMIGVGLMVGVIIIAMYMPMFKMLTLVK